MQLTRKGFLGAGLALAAAPTFGFIPKDKDGKPIEGFTDLNPGTLKDEPWQPFSDKKVRVGIAGEGYCAFGSQFGYQDHPNCEVVACTDVDPQRCARLQERTKAKRTYASCEEMIEKEKEIDAVYIATDAPSHVRLSIMALEHGLHVVTAVPAFFGTEQLEMVPKLVEAVKKSGKLYMMNETSAFRADNYKMRKLYEAGYFGAITYCEGEYIHGDPPYTTKAKKAAHNSYKGWRDGLPPQFYPTHSNGYYTCITHKRFLDVTCRGLPSLKEVYHQNRYNNPYGAEYAFLRCEDGATARMIVQWDTPSTGGEKGRIWGQKGSYDRWSGYKGWFEKEIKAREQEWLKPQLPPGMPYGAHGGSHGYLTDDFLRGILLKDHKVCVDLKTALDTTIAGVYAHMSAMKDGETLKIPETVA